MAQNYHPWLARALYWASLFAIFAYPALLISQLLIRDIPQAYVAAYPALVIDVPPTGMRLAVLLAMDTVEICVTLLILWQVRALFAAFSKSGEPSADVARRLTQTGGLLILQGVLAVLIRAGESVILTMVNAPGQKSLSIAFSSTEFALLIAGGLLICTGRALGTGAAAVSENRGFI